MAIQANRMENGIASATTMLGRIATINCVFRGNPATDSGATRPPIPFGHGHLLVREGRGYFRGTALLVLVLSGHELAAEGSDEREEEKAQHLLQVGSWAPRQEIGQ